MKIKITYTDEKELAELFNKPLKEFVNSGAKIKKSDKNAPYLHCYIELNKGKLGKSAARD